ncbi:midasin [Cornus florida]|uniref:midasin n=1 Tax=Cornus florida TaxID=4283 RepID=UPI0028A170E9|nr:midasin [Cornus florida]
MAIDGSFCLESELERFLSRCPELAFVPQFRSLVEKGHLLTEEEVVNSVAELFLHPNYTIPLVGCFRPLVRKIMDRTVTLLQMVPDLRSNSDNFMEDFEEHKFLRETGNLKNSEGVRVIDFYVRSGKGLNLHELACLAFCRAVDLAPFLLGYVLNYFKFAPPPFERIMQKKTVSELLEKAGTELLNDFRASYRLLSEDPEVFATLWDWSCFLEFVQQSADIDPGDNIEGFKDLKDIRWCGIQILSIILKLSNRATSNFGLGAEEAFACLLRWQEFCQDVSLEKAGWYLESFEEKKSVSINKNMYLDERCHLQSFELCSSSVSSSKFNEIGSSNWSRGLGICDMTSTGKPFVLTSAVKKSVEMVLLAVSQKWPVLLYGTAGSGKTALINKLALDSGNRVLSIHMDDQIDGKTLIGSYVCTEQPGEFRWQPGFLTQAVLNGYWVVFEDIDKAPSDVQSILLPLLEGSSSFLTGHVEGIKVAERFRLFSTISSLKLDVSCTREGGSINNLWRKVLVGPSTDQDLLRIVKARYPDLEPIAGKLLETFERVNQLAGFQFGSASLNSLSRFSLRDLLKWCKRIAGFGFSFGRDGLSTYVCNSIYQEAVDIFAAFSSSVENRLTIMKDIAKLWAVPISAAETLYPVNKPVIQDLHVDLRIGRITLQRNQESHDKKQRFVEIRSSLHVLERIACSIKYNEPVLLVGETGTGKTTLVQNLARRLGRKLTVLNLSQQSDAADLLGGFKPMNAQFVCIPLYKEFEILFTNTFSSKDNEKVLASLKKLVSNNNWEKLVSGLRKYAKKVAKIGRSGLLETESSGSGRKRNRPLDEKLLRAWKNFYLKLKVACAQITASSGMIFSFVEGAFVTALRNGDWILLDELNLAPPETLQRVIGVLEEENGSLCLVERGDVDYIHRHPNFRIFACMNPATDAGKRDLPYSLRSRFTEYFVDDVLEDEDLVVFINHSLDGSHLNSELVDKVVRFYKAAKKESEERLQDGANQKPQYSLRSLYRALEYTNIAGGKFGFQKALYDGFCMFFLTLLDEPSAKVMKQMILSYLMGGNLPPHVPFSDYLKIDGNSSSGGFLENYVLTKSVKEHLRSLARAIFGRRYPVLLQGPTSSGKTSLVQYLAAITGHEFVRINNHEHTDLQEYLGSYVTDASGKLVFQEGVLVKAVRNGYWIVLDELNLAPSDVLEALNRLLDDNRELFVPELNETVRAHRDFMLFATQNPPTFYGGRKMLSRAFRNRFVEIHVDEIPETELSTILEKRCLIPESYAMKMVEVMKELQLRRQTTKVFAGKHGFITPRDLFRWAGRFRTFGNSYADLASEGFFLLAERLRDETERTVVQEVLERKLRTKLAKDDLYKQEPEESDKVINLCKYSEVFQNLGRIAWTKSLWRLFFLVERCYKLREPVLLVGETGGGKTTVCQLLSIVLGSKLHILNCHQYTETSDFLGGFHPVRERSEISSEFRFLCEQLILSKPFIHFPDNITISSDIGQASFTLDNLAVIIKSYRQELISHPDVSLQDLNLFEQMKLDLAQLYQKWKTIFMWQDGPLVQAMKNGDLFLVDEISLADDSVLERLNSVLEPERKLSLAEKGGSDLEKVTAHPNFFLLATMNPGGDYGKKELSPALRNRFTEIWVPPVNDLNELRSIALQRISDTELSCVVDPMLNFWEWFNKLQTGRTLTVRDLLSWIAFINVTTRSLQPELAFVHGAFLVLLDGLSLGTGISKSEAGELRDRCLSFLLGQLKVGESSLVDSNLSMMENYGWADIKMPGTITCNDDRSCDSLFGIHPFYIEKGDDNLESDGFEFLAPTTCRNTLRVLRAMQLAKPVLLEGSPGVGKTSLIVALAKYSGHKIVRINLSEQTDIMDLLGSDLPVESDEGMHFAWSDGILLQAIKKGSWVLLDEINLAPQSVLEGLNAILDHRAEVFIPELGLTFKCPPSFRVFACQNPSFQGGGRKGLPKSFLNRFIKVYVDELLVDDYVFICNSLYPSIPKDILSKLILFNKRLHEETMLHHKFAQDGSPWEFNLRDVIRSCQIIQGAPEGSKFDCFLNTIYVQRMRTAADRREVIQLYEQVFGLNPYLIPYPRVQLTTQYLIVGNTCIKRNHFQSPKVSNSGLKILPGIRHSLEAAAQCVEHQWLCILIGPPSSGKTSLIRLLAQLTGNVLNELNLSSAIDISELIGCFEQYNAFRNYRLTIAQVECYINEYCSLKLEFSSEAFIGRRKDLITRWLSFLSKMDCGPTTLASASAYTENWNTRSFDSISLLVEIIEHLRLDLMKNPLPVSWSCEDLDRTRKTLLKLQEDHQTKPYSAKFEWVTGLLIKAIENGEWIVLENANTCNPTVFDRINSLVEPHGSITVHERGTVDGKALVIHPHPQFRMFLTVNPSYGEVSRAMRNRGVEIYMMEPDWLLEAGSGDNRDETRVKDVKRFLTLSGIPVGMLVDSMANSHIYAKNEALRFHINITCLELARWVQLFQRLLTNGNQLVWSLQISWEHTYLSSLGEAEGKDIVSHVILSYLSMDELFKFDLSLASSLCSPGGWPTPLKLRDYVWYSKETSVKQNCMYLEFLGAQSASYTFHISLDRCPMQQALTASGYLLDMETLQLIMSPKASNEKRIEKRNYVGRAELDLALARKMLFFAANWTIEQANESDIELYFCWFSWFGSRVMPFCNFFSSFLMLLKQEFKHPIWNYIVCCRRELMSRLQFDLDSKPIPMLSLEIVDLFASDDMSKSSSKILCNAINCVGLLRLSLQQWNAESEYDFSEKTQCFIPVLRSLQTLEEKVLDMLVESPTFDVLFRLYNELLGDHISFWNSILSSQFEHSLISWRSLIKNAVKFREICPREVESLQMESKHLDGVSSWRFHLQKSLLWVHGGHPIVPSSADLYQKQHQLLNFCELVWPRKRKPWKQASKDCPIEAVVSSDPELRFLAMQGVCMSTYIVEKVKGGDSHAVQELEEMHQMLLKRFEHEKNKLQATIGATRCVYSMADFTTCCVFSSDIRDRWLGFDSWQDTLPITDSNSSFLDMELLQELSKIVFLDAEELHHALSSLSDSLVYTRNFSLNFSSRPPSDFLPHQKILWSLDAWPAVDSVNMKVASFVLEMWFSWHSSLWTPCPALVENLSRIAGCEPDMLFQPVKAATVNQILKGAFAIKDYHIYSLKLRVASRSLWQCSPMTNLHSFLLSTARTIFQQIIYTHRKTFEADVYAVIKSVLCSFQKNTTTEDSIKELVSHLASSSHHGLTSLMGLFIEPVLGELYLQCPSTDILYALGCAWVRIGGLSYHLLISCDDLDPSLKYSCKHTQLAGRIELLELENKVRQECSYLAGSFYLSENGKQRTMLLENLKSECKRLQRKIVFRSDPAKFKKLKYECDEFLKLIGNSIGLIKNVESMDLQQITDQVQNWQETATCFIDRLSCEYAAYVDIVQPVQFAIYDMKLGLALVFSSSLQKKFLHEVGQDDMDKVLDTLYSFMRFPRGCASKAVSVNVNSGLAKFPYYDVEFPTNTGDMDINLLGNLVAFRGGVTSKTLSVLQEKAAINQNILARVVHSVSESQLMDYTSFTLLDKIFEEFARLWMSMKVEVKNKEDREAQQYKFRTRAFKMEDIFEIDISTLSVANESFSEWRDFLADEEFTEREVDEKGEILEEEWNFMKESILDNVVRIHNQLFGSMDLVQAPGFIQVSDADRLASFIDSYTLGIGMIKDLEGLFCTTLDAKLVPEHLLRLCLEQQKVISSHNFTHSYNFYKDSNAPVMAKMVELITILRQRILHLLNEWEDHPALQKIVDVTELILAIPLTTPLAKALSGLQFLTNRVRTLQETVSKFPLSDQLEPIFVLVSTWQKMEFDCWPALLNEVQGQYEVNAGKLWFPLYSVLQHRHAAAIVEYDQSTIQSLDEFIRTSSIGEFKKRLQLLIAFHGQISAGICRGSYSSPCQMENVKILYNIFGFYVQFLPVILEHIEVNRRNIEMELREVLKLCRWERPDMAFENSKRTRQKLRKIIQKFTDLLQQPVLLILNREVGQSEIRTLSIQGPKIIGDSFNQSREILNVACNQIQFRDDNWVMWFADWREKAYSAWKSLNVEGTPEFDFLYFPFKDTEEVGSAFGHFLAPQSSHLGHQEKRKQLWCTIETICRTAIDCGDLWKDENKNLGKRRALSDLLKLLDNCGLSKHRSTLFEDQFRCNQSGSWLLQPSYEVKHLLLTHGRLSAMDVDVSASSQSQCLPYENLDTQMTTVNQDYFKSLASVHLLQQICLNFHKDFTLEQVNRSWSFIDHLIVIQQEQRASAYGFTEQLTCLRKCILPLENVFSNASAFNCMSSVDCPLIHNQHATYKCMWQQKQLLDSLCVMLHEEGLLLKAVEDNHLDSCQNVKSAAYRLHVFIEKFVPDFQKSKDILDNYLLGHNRIITVETVPLHPSIISKQMEELVLQNFKFIKEFEEHLCTFRMELMDRRSVEKALLGRFEDIFKMGNLVAEEYNYALQGTNESENIEEESKCFQKKSCELKAEFGDALKGAYKCIMDAFDRVGSLNNDHAFPDGSPGNITECQIVFESCIENLRLDLVCDEVLKTIYHGVKLVNDYSNEDPNLPVLVGAYLKHLYLLLDLLLAFGNQLLHDFLAMHRMVSMVTHVLAGMFASLYSKGFGTSTEDEDTIYDKTQNASGTGMGEGAGQTDVSDQLNNEDQLLVASVKPNEEQDASSETPSKNDKGIEMEQDFAADTFSISEDSGDDGEEDGDNEQLESAMGETGADSEIIDEKLWDKHNDENPDNRNEKYEPGPSVEDGDSSGRELRAKEDPSSVANEAEELNPDEFEKQNDSGNQDGLDNTENFEDINIDKEEAFADPTGLKLDEPNKGSEEDIDMDEQEGADPMESADPNELDESAENESGEDGKANSIEKTLEGAETEEVDGNAERDDLGNNQTDSTEMDLAAPEKDAVERNASNLLSDQVPNTKSDTQPKGDSHAADLREVAPEAKGSNSSGIQHDPSPMRGLPNATETEITVADSSNGGRLSDDQFKSQLPQHDSSSLQKTQPNPCRDVGNALDEWKERVKVSFDLQNNDVEAPDDMMDEDADEYGYTFEFDKGTAQALGPATSEQMDRNINGDKADADGKDLDREEIAAMEIDKHDSEKVPIKSHALSLRNEIEKQMKISDQEMPPEEPPEIHSHVDGHPGILSESLVTLNRSYMSEDINQLGKLSVSDNELGKAHNLEEVSSDVKNNATTVWRRYELLTTRLSQELAEQLRLVMEPTLASKLQGDYRTGKRINMKKVIDYIASLYRKDKIWLRRTRPNKRDYQIVIAVDDSRSMSESHCGDVAIEALVTVCRAMSQLEVGKLAVASFGKKGNIKLLHDFDQPLTPEAGIKMISSLTFKQDNTIADEPMVDLLKFLNNLLDAAVANARLPSGQNPLQQLVLIIADGRFHEKENLKRCVRDALNRKRMVAFLLLDSPEESIMDLMEASFQGGNIKFSKYLDSFPFPYYIVLKNIEALPRTLADLLRQWFELMQHSRD